MVGEVGAKVGGPEVEVNQEICGHLEDGQRGHMGGQDTEGAGEGGDINLEKQITVRNWQEQK